MSIRIYKIAEYDHQAEQRQFDEIVRILSLRFADATDDALLIGNYNIEGVELDGLLITSSGIQVLEFKNWGGNIIARENGAWTSGNLIIDGGASDKNPFVQIRSNRSRTAQGLSRYLGQPVRNVQALIIFAKPSCIDVAQLSPTVKLWLKLCDSSDLASSLLTTNVDHNLRLFSPEDFAQLPSKLGIEEFQLSDTPQPRRKFGRELTAASFYEALRNALPLSPRAAYHEFSLALRLAVDQKTQFNTLRLGGLYAKIDYLCREYHVARDLVRSINDTRVRSKRVSEFSDEELESFRLQDLKAICRFINAIYGEPIPSNLVSLFPEQERRVSTGQLISDSLRIYVTSWDDNYFYGHCENLPDVEQLKVCYNMKSDYARGDWSYLKDYFLRDCQVNLVHPRLKDGIYYPELIILDPDYLVDITSICKCFEEYAHSPLLHLVSKVEPFENTAAIMLGNFAGQLLDEEIHSDPSRHSYSSSYDTFIQSNAFSALTTDHPKLKGDGEMQQQNIRRALNEGLAQRVGQYRRSEIILEPSFFSEMLGLQGRMDMISLDYHILLEQKSGKGAFQAGRPDSGIPMQQQKHYVQLLLYMAILHYNYGMNNSDISAFLLYSRYTEGLLGLSSAPELLFEALKLRNGIAWCENLFCRGGIRLLGDLKPETFMQLSVNDSFWNRYILPKLQSVFDPLSKASSLEKAYFYRFMTFLENEHMLAKVGNKTKENSGFAAKWYDTLEEKHQAGNIYDSLTLIDPTPDHVGAVEKLTFGFLQAHSIDTSNFRKGDIVVAYPYAPGSEPDVRRSMVFRCTITELKAESIELELRAPQSDQRVFLHHAGSLWAIEHDFFDSSSSSLYRGMHSLLTAPQERRDLLLMQRKPEIDASRTLIGDYKEFNDLALHVRQARDLFLIIGPPGTGKTSYGMLYTLQEQLLTPGSNVLIMSYTNRAVDEICSKLDEEGIDFIRLGGRHSCEPRYQKYLLDSKVQGMEISSMRQLVDHTRVFVGTTSTLNSSQALFSIKHFDLAIVDEASQILEPHLVGLFSARYNDIPAIRKFVMIGDEKQLPAVVQQEVKVSRVTDPELNAIGLTDCRLSLFERLLRRYRNNPEVVYMLRRQGRMHPDIALFPNLAFYQGQLQIVPLQHQQETLPTQTSTDNDIDNLLLTRRIAFIATPPLQLGNELQTIEQSDKVNPIEADMIAATIVHIYHLEKDSFEVDKTIGVIVPYRNQIATIRQAVDRYSIPCLHDITIDTVERFQGSQRDFILYGFTIQREYQLSFLTNNDYEDQGNIIDRKLNVAMTRARRHLLLFGNTALLQLDPVFSNLIDFIKERNSYFEPIPEQFLQGKISLNQE